MHDNPPCLCGSQLSYRDCCGRFHDQTLFPETPEQLMRSRYVAFCMNLVDYLIDTRHPAFREPEARQKIENAKEDHRWLALSILDAPAPTGDIGSVEFVAYVQAHSRPHVEQLHEKSEFVREGDRWYYTHGEFLPDIKLGRNDPCWCGSGKKYKKCHQGMAIV